jgi:hypothetical protein
VELWLRFCHATHVRVKLVNVTFAYVVSFAHQNRTLISSGYLGFKSSLLRDDLEMLSVMSATTVPHSKVSDARLNTLSSHFAADACVTAPERASFADTGTK